MGWNNPLSVSECGSIFVQVVDAEDEDSGPLFALPSLTDRIGSAQKNPGEIKGPGLVVTDIGSGGIC